MKKSELRNIIREEIKRITEGGDLIVLYSIKMLIDSYTGALYPMQNDMTPSASFMYGEVEPGTPKYKKLLSKLDSRDKKIVKSLEL